MVAQVLDDHALLQQQDAGGDFRDEAQVVTGDDDGSAQLLVHLADELGHGNLRRRVEVVERLVEDEHLGVDDHRADDARFLAVALRELAQVFLRAENFVVHQRAVLLQAAVERGLVNTVGSSAAVGNTSTSSTVFFLATDEQDIDVTIETLNADGAVLFSKTVTNVPFKRNRVTKLTGKMYTNDAVGGTFQVETAWLDEETINF